MLAEHNYSYAVSDKLRKGIRVKFYRASGMLQLQNSSILCIRKESFRLMLYSLS